MTESPDYPPTPYWGCEACGHEIRVVHAELHLKAPPGYEWTEAKLMLCGACVRPLVTSAADRRDQAMGN